MTLPLFLWARRSTALLAFPAMLVVVFLMLFSRTGWSWERSQAVSWSTSSTILLGPLAAGLVAFDIWRRQTPTMRELTASTRRGTLGVLALAIATGLLSVLAWLVGVAVALVLAARNGAAGPIPWWTIAQGLVTVLACVCVGALVGTGLRNVAAAPLATVLCYLVPVVATLFGVRGVMAAGGATAPIVGLTEDHTIALTTIVATALLGAVSWQVARSWSAPTGAAAIVTVTVLGVGLAGSLVYLNTLSPMTAVMRPGNSPDVCVGTAPRVCGPEEGIALYRVAADDLASAARSLARDGIAVGDRYDYPRGNVVLPPDVGMVSLDPSQFSDGHLSAWDVALTIATPAVCPEYYADVPPHELLDAQGSVASWIADRLAGGDTAPGDVEGARAALAALRACDDGAVPSWRYVG